MRSETYFIISKYHRSQGKTLLNQYTFLHILLGYFSKDTLKNMKLIEDLIFNSKLNLKYSFHKIFVQKLNELFIHQTIVLCK